MKKETPLSPRAKWRLRRLWLSGYTPDPEFGFGGDLAPFLFLWLFFALFAIPAILITLAAGNLLISILVIPAILLVLAVPLYFMVRSYKKTKAKILAKNREDYELSLKINEATNYLINNPPNLVKGEYPQLVRLNGIKPVRIDYFPESSLDGEFRGRIWGGWGLFSFSGNLEGKIKGEATPELYNQNVVIIGTAEDGTTIRLICPSILVIRRNLRDYFQQIADEYGNASHSFYALLNFWETEGGLKGLLMNANPQRIFDQLVTELEKPLNERETFNVKGIKIREGAFLVSIIRTDQLQAEMVTPIDLMEDVKMLLGSQLPRALPEPKF